MPHLPPQHWRESACIIGHEEQRITPPPLPPLLRDVWVTGFPEDSLKFDGFWFVNPAVPSPAAEPNQTKGVFAGSATMSGIFSLFLDTHTHILTHTHTKQRAML